MGKESLDAKDVFALEVSLESLKSILSLSGVVLGNQKEETGVRELSRKESGISSGTLFLRVLDSFPESSRTSRSSAWFLGATPDELSRISRKSSDSPFVFHIVGGSRISKSTTLLKDLESERTWEFLKRPLFQKTPFPKDPFFDPDFDLHNDRV